MVARPRDGWRAAVGCSGSTVQPFRELVLLALGLVAGQGLEQLLVLRQDLLALHRAVEFEQQLACPGVVEHLGGLVNVLDDLVASPAHCQYLPSGGVVDWAVVTNGAT